MKVNLLLFRSVCTRSVLYNCTLQEVAEVEAFFKKLLYGTYRTHGGWSCINHTDRRTEHPGFEDRESAKKCFPCVLPSIFYEGL